MKRNYLAHFVTLFLLVLCIHVSNLNAQIPNLFKYQAVLRDANGNIIANQLKNIEISILRGSESGVEVFSETHNVNTTAQGLINLNIGSINTVGFNAIDWAANSYFLKLTVDGVAMGTSQILSVPYAFVANTVTTYDYQNLTSKPELFSGDYNSTLTD